MMVIYEQLVKEVQWRIHSKLHDSLTVCLCVFVWVGGGGGGGLFIQHGFK